MHSERRQVVAVPLADVVLVADESLDCNRGAGPAEVTVHHEVAVAEAVADPVLVIQLVDIINHHVTNQCDVRSAIDMATKQHV